MPALATPTRPSNRGGSVKASPAKPLDIGQPLGIHDTNTVRSRVRQWQQQGGGVITINDGTYDDDGDENQNQPRPLPASAKAKPDQVEKPDTEKERAAENGLDLEARKEEKKPKEKDKVPAVRKRSHSTPRKRVISDEHWRKNRSSTQTPSRNLPAPRRINEYTTNGGAGSPRARREIHKDVLDKTRDPPKFKHYRIQNGSPPTVDERRHSASRKDVDSVTDSECAGEHPGSVMASEMPSDMSKITSLPEDTEWAKSEADFTELSRRRARGPSKPPKGGIFAHMLDESRKMFKLPEPEPPRPTPPPAGTRGAKIEAWLSETPDPFVETNNPKTDMPGPLDIKSARARRSQRIVDEIATSNPMSDISHDSEARPKSSGSRPKSSHSRHSTHSEGSCATKDDGRAPQGSHASSVEKPLALRIRRDKEKAHEPSEIDSLAPSESDFQPFSDGGSEVSGNNAPVPVGLKRPFPSTGLHRLSTIASRDTLSTLPEETTVSEKDPAEQKRPLTAEEAEEAAEKVDHFDPNSLPGVTSQLQRRLTTHKDLMSVLSVSTSRGGSTRSRRSVRSNRSRIAHATISDLLAELRADEVKYMRELKTLVGGVVPVLLTCVLSRSDSAIAAGLFRPSLDPKDDLNFSKPIVNMGVATERLKTLHKRIPQEDVDALLAWAQGAQRVYREYLKAWRLGFKDVIVNLAPLEEGDVDGNADTKSLDEGMERDDQGDIIGANGEKVDVAYLLKRPLVRLKYLAKTFKGINNLQPSAKAEDIATAYASLVAEARKRARDERARLEDESAASIDPTRARDPMTLGLSSNVVVDQTRRVRARDFFNLSFYHSSGQLIDCRAELLYRDNTSSNGPGGDLLICEIDHSERWLLFPPMDLRCVSARVGDSKGEIVVMLRSAPEDERYWQELISLRIDEVDIVLEWVSLLGQDPIPPALCRSQSFISRAKQHKSRRSDVADSSPRANSSDVEVPIGEKVARKRRSLTPKDHTTSSNISTSSVTDLRCSVLSATSHETENSTISDDTASKGTTRPGLPQLPSTMSEKSVGALKRSKAKRHSRHADSPNPGTSLPQTGHIAQPTDAGLSVQTRFYGNGANTHETTSVKETTPKKAAHAPRPRESPEKESPRVSSTPSAYLPMIPKIRSSSSQTHLSSPSTPTHEEEEDYPPLDALPESPAFETPSRSERRKSRRKSKHEESPPPPPPHRTPSSSPNKLSNSPILPASGHRIQRRGSSPLKHEYEPSTASDYSETDSEASTVRHYTYSSSDSSESGSDSASCSSFSDDEEDEIEPPKPVLPQPSASDASSLSPSNSVSQGGYRTVPLQPTKSTKALATVFAWSDKGSWDSLVPDECSVVVSPGLIEAFNVGNGMNPSAPDRAYPHLKPVISMELTPLVPIRRGTAIDISIRSPPTDRSKMTSSNNIMFRSRNPDECDALYSLINQARLNNPTYIALQNARGPMYDNFVPDFEQPTEKAASNWFGFPRRRKSYRASDSPRSLAEGSESSVGTMSSAFSALKRFRGGSKMFNISRSTVISRSGREDSLYSSSGASSDPSPSSGIGRIAAAIKGADGIGLSNAKIRLYLRETASKWRDMGAARLTIMPAPPKNSPSRPGTAVSSATEDLKDDREESASPPSSGATTPRRDAESEKRIIIRGKTRGEILLDVCLPESSFERVARTGIAVSVYEENEGGVIAKQGGVGTGTQRIYMLQLKSEAEAAYTFGLVGKLRY